MYHNTMLMKDAHAGFTPVLGEMGRGTPTWIMATLLGQQRRERGGRREHRGRQGGVLVLKEVYGRGRG